MANSPEEWLKNAEMQAASRTAAASSVHWKSIGPLQDRDVQVRPGIARRVERWVDAAALDGNGKML
jgi:hypothetical protein